MVSPADDMTFMVDLYDNRVSVSDGSNPHRELLSFMSVATKVPKVSCDAFMLKDGYTVDLQ